MQFSVQGDCVSSHIFFGIAIICDHYGQRMILFRECWNADDRERMGSLHESQRCRLCGEETEEEEDIFTIYLQVKSLSNYWVSSQ